MAIEYIKGLTRLAARLQDHFKRAVSKQSLQNWKRDVPPLPIPTADGRYNWEECRAWFEANKQPKPRTQDELDLFQKSVNAKYEQEITKAATLKREEDEALGRLIDKDAARRAVIGVAKRYHNIVRMSLEQHQTASRRDKLNALGVSQEIVALFHEHDLKLAQTLVDMIERECEEQGKAKIDA